MVLLTTTVTLSADLGDAEGRPRRKRVLLLPAIHLGGGAGSVYFVRPVLLLRFHELALIPTFLLIGIWGHGENRVAAAWKITIYLAASAASFSCSGLIGLYASLPPLHRTFDLTQIDAILPSTSTRAAQILDFPAGAGRFRHPGLAVPVPYLGTRRRTPPRRRPPPCCTRACLKKFGLYGLLRVAVPLLPLGMQHWMNVFLVLLVGNILYVGFVTIAQKRLDMMLGYSSVMHMGYIFLGISSLNVIGLSGAAMMMFAHGLSIAVLFAVAGEVRARTGTMRLDELGGLARVDAFPHADFRAGHVRVHRPAGICQFRVRIDGVLRLVPGQRSA